MYIHPRNAAAPHRWRLFAPKRCQSMPSSRIVKQYGQTVSYNRGWRRRKYIYTYIYMCIYICIYIYFIIFYLYDLYLYIIIGTFVCLGAQVQNSNLGRCPGDCVRVAKMLRMDAVDTRVMAPPRRRCERHAAGWEEELRRRSCERGVVKGLRKESCGGLAKELRTRCVYMYIYIYILECNV